MSQLEEADISPNGADSRFDTTQTLAAGCVMQLRLFLRVSVAGVLC